MFRLTWPKLLYKDEFFAVSVVDNDNDTRVDTHNLPSFSDAILSTQHRHTSLKYETYKFEILILDFRIFKREHKIILKKYETYKFEILLLYFIF